jgi:hypothetical protein
MISPFPTLVNLESDEWHVAVARKRKSNRGRLEFVRYSEKDEVAISEKKVEYLSGPERLHPINIESRA